MKKTVLFFILAAIGVFSVIAGCKKNPPAAPANAPTPIASYTDLASVPGGTFTQTDGTNSFIHTISSFMMGKYQVTYDLWYKVYQWALANGYTFQNAGAEGVAGTAGAAPTAARYQPVTTADWRDVIVWCNAFSRMAGLMPVYYSDAGFTSQIKDSSSGPYDSSINAMPGSFDNPYINRAASGYRLPTEGEYQYAASYVDGSSWTPYNYASGATGDTNNAIANEIVAWYHANSGATQDVGGKTPNSLGIYDMSGNVWELCWDWNSGYPTGPVTDYLGPVSASERVTRGGSFATWTDNLAVGFRSGLTPYDAHSDTGFRFARTF